jgi:hypothetical protein
VLRPAPAGNDPFGDYLARRLHLTFREVEIIRGLSTTG